MVGVKALPKLYTVLFDRLFRSIRIPWSVENMSFYIYFVKFPSVVINTCIFSTTFPPKKLFLSFLVEIRSIFRRYFPFFALGWAPRRNGNVSLVVMRNSPSQYDPLPLPKICQMLPSQDNKRPFWTSWAMRTGRGWWLSGSGSWIYVGWLNVEWFFDGSEALFFWFNRYDSWAICLKEEAHQLMWVYASWCRYHLGISWDLFEIFLNLLMLRQDATECISETIIYSCAHFCNRFPPEISFWRPRKTRGWYNILYQRLKIIYIITSPKHSFWVWTFHFLYFCGCLDVGCLFFRPPQQDMKRKVHLVFASLFTDRAISYRHDRGTWEVKTRRK